MGVLNLGWRNLSPTLLKQVIQDCITLRERGIRLTPTRQSSTATKWYLEAKFEAQPLTKARVGGGPLDQAGLAMLVQCRIGWFLTGNVLVHCKRIPDWFEDRYPFCDFDGEETLEHIFFDCPFWEQSRARHLSSVISEIDAMCVASTSVFDHNRLSWLLGGKYCGRGLPNWMPPPPLTLVDLGIGGAKAVAVGDEVDELAASFARLELNNIVELTASFARLQLDGAKDGAAASRSLVLTLTTDRLEVRHPALVPLLMGTAAAASLSLGSSLWSRAFGRLPLGPVGASFNLRLVPTGSQHPPRANARMGRADRVLVKTKAASSDAGFLRGATPRLPHTTCGAPTPSVCIP